MSLILLLSLSFFTSNSSALSPGEADPTFGGSSGYVNFLYGGVSGGLSGALPLSNGDVIPYGSFQYSTYSNQKCGAMKVLNNGTNDTSFATSGFYSSGTKNCRFTDGFESLDNKIILFGSYTPSYSTPSYFIHKLNTDGSLDTSFGTSGVLSVPAASRIAQGTDGSIYTFVCEYKTVSGVTTSKNFVRKYSENGTLDTTFGTLGQVTINAVSNTEFGYGFTIDKGNSLTGQPDKLMIQNYASPTKLIRLYRLTSGGVLDTTYGTSGYADYTIPTDQSYAFQSNIVVDSNHRTLMGWNIVSSGTGYNNFLVTRFTSSGSLDTSYGTSGFAKSNWTSPYPSGTYKNIMVNNNDEAILIGFYVKSAPSATVYKIAAFKANGSLDTNFNSTGQLDRIYLNSPSDTTPISIFPTIDEKFYVLGGKGYYNALARIQGPGPPNNTTLPAISGTPMIGEQLTTSNGTWGGYGTMSHTYQWQRCTDTTLASCSNISGATTNHYTLDDADYSKRIRVVVTANNGSGENYVTSNATDEIITSDPAQRFRPILRFDTDEYWRPLDVETFLSEGATYPGNQHQVCERDVEDSCHDISSADDLKDCDNYESGCDFSSEREYYINVKGDYDDTPVIGNDSESYHSPDTSCIVANLRDCNSGVKSKIYQHTTHNVEQEMNYYDYWFFYRYDEVYGMLGDSSWNHEGDWESATVAASDNNPNTFNFVTFSSHEHPPWRYLRGALICDSNTSCGSETSKTGNRVNLFVANGTHASYPKGCLSDCPQVNMNGEDAIPEADYDGTKVWGNNNEISSLVNLPTFYSTNDISGVKKWSEATDVNSDGSLDDVEWTNWPGRWGDKFPELSTLPDPLKASSPEGPGVRVSRFFTPWLRDDCTTMWGGTDECLRSEFLASTSTEGEYLIIDDINTEVTFTAAATGGTPTKYQWDLNGDLVTGFDGDKPIFRNDFNEEEDFESTSSNPIYNFDIDSELDEEDFPIYVTLIVTDQSGYTSTKIKKVCVDTCVESVNRMSSQESNARFVTNSVPDLAQRNDCDDWAGPFVQVLVCEPGKYEDWLHGDATKPSTAKVSGSDYQVAAEPGLTQVIDSNPLRPGDEVIISSTVPADAELQVKTTHNDKDVISIFELDENIKKPVISIYKSRAGKPTTRIKHGNDYEVPDKVETK